MSTVQEHKVKQQVQPSGHASQVNSEVRAKPAKDQQPARPSGYGVGFRGIFRRVVRAVTQNHSVQRFAAAAAQLQNRGTEAMSWAAQRATEIVADFETGAQIFMAQMLEQAEKNAQIEAEVAKAVSGAGKPGGSGKKKSGLIDADLLFLEGGLVSILVDEVAAQVPSVEHAHVVARETQPFAWAWARDADAGASVLTRFGKVAQHDDPQHTQVPHIPQEQNTAVYGQSDAAGLSHDGDVADTALEAQRRAAEFSDLDQQTVYGLPIDDVDFDGWDHPLRDRASDGTVAVEAGTTVDVLSQVASGVDASRSVLSEVDPTQDAALAHFLDEHTYIVSENSIVRTRLQHGEHGRRVDLGGVDLLKNAVNKFSQHDIVYAAMGHAFQPPLRTLAMHSLLHSVSRSDRPMMNAIAFDQGFEGRGGGRDDGGQQGHEGSQHEQAGSEAEELEFS